MESSRQHSKHIALGDAAVEGLLAGMAAGAVMAAFILLVEWVTGSAPLMVLGYFDASGGGSPLAGLFTHFAVAGVYGVIFGLITARLTRVPRMWMIAFGIVYGIAIFAVAEWVILPRTVSALAQVPFRVMALAHGIYGAALGVVFASERR